MSLYSSDFQNFWYAPLKKRRKSMEVFHISRKIRDRQFGSGDTMLVAAVYFFGFE